ncbi:UPF0149 family protein [Agaribacterium haliotis]|uniref:UPF0149 family protein n=1 Tax=Agaribacterium haliotis TaxID=2013869 RepID=UPI000BB5868D|nr:UPF0149 family protein [Agaribacterium haliotis]
MKFEYQFHSLSDQLLTMGAVCSAAELHGMLCGLVAGGKNTADDDWLELAREFSDLSHFEINDKQVLLIEFLRSSCIEALASEQFEFEPLLPDDRCPINERARELGAWCRGFLHGFGCSGLDKDKALPENVVEVVRDLAQISQAVKAVEDEEDETEADLVELVEYLRAGVMTIYQEMRAPDDQESSKVVH